MHERSFGREDAVETLKEAGLRVTQQRTAALTLLHNTPKHCTVDEIYELLKDTEPTISLATLYNTMRAFVEAGLLLELPFVDGASRYDVNTDPHHHLICDRCGSMTDVVLPEPALADTALQHHFQVRRCHIEVRGLCETCATQMPS